MAETSRDKDNNVSLIQSDISVINFDAVAREWKKDRECTNDPASNDVLFEDKEKDCLVFIEFKNGKIESKERRNLHKKLYESLIVLADILEKPMGYIRNHVEYILVYNLGKNPNDGNSGVSESAGINSIGQTVAGYGGKEVILFKLDQFQTKKFVKDVHTYTAAEFQTKFLDRVCTRSAEECEN